MIGHKDFPSRSGGVETVVLELSSFLARDGYDITVYNRGKHKKDKVMGVTRRGSPTLRSGGSDAVIASFTATFDAIFRRYDIIHYHAIGPSAALFIPHFLRIKTVATIHGLDWQRNKWGKFASWYLKLGEKTAAKYADEVIVLSEDVQKYFLEKYGRKTTLIKNAITPVEEVEIEECKKFGLEKYGYILYLGRLTPEKGLRELIEAYLKTETDKKLVIAGELEDTDFVREIKEMASSSENIIFTGFVSGRMMNELYSNASLFVLPSHIEGLALTLLEAMSCGTRCLVSDIRENTDVLKDFGYVFKVKDVESLTEALKKALSEPPENKFKDEQKEYILKNYSYDDAVEKYKKLYDEVI
ncbi:MAG: glycosyltransferase family 4 protein [Clostridiales bacterium]|nr:glycosyltransferase family 4 protein [Clostridiales bacterium]